QGQRREVQAAAVGRLPHRVPARPERQALQAQAAGSLLGGAGEQDLMASHSTTSVSAPTQTSVSAPTQTIMTLAGSGSGQTFAQARPASGTVMIVSKGRSCA